ncbi:phage head-tail joining protein [Oceanospirillum beijerinckii]|uniref:phage head-tail joining protein n=1 Tax=Oceanospirillum beijerinckii TaxID=64976 RepID=UPI00040D889A|nr:gpW family head-tail joining protein [Oceanospirillum beijerinckii]
MATQAQLDEARAALHALSIGKGVASIQKDGRKVDYTPANVGSLRAYIRELESVLASSQRRRAFRVF